MAVYIDQTGQSLNLNTVPQRIISLVPSQTELLFDLGLTDKVVGITKFCVHPPEWLTTKNRVGGTKQINMGLIHQLDPDLVIANKEENVKEQVEELQQHYPTWVSDINNLEDAYQMIEQVGIMTGKAAKANEINDRIKNNFSQLTPTISPLRTAYLVWQKPYMTVGGDTFIDAMMKSAGFENIFADQRRYPEITIEDLQKVNCQLLLLSSEPFPFKQKHIDTLQNLLPAIKIVLVDGEMFSWYGSRMLQAPAYFEKLQQQIR